MRRTNHNEIPKDHEVRPVIRNRNRPGIVTCNACGLSWNDDKITGWTPAPSGRCPFEYHHKN